MTGYEVRRNGSSVGTPSGTSFTDSGLAASTSYSYQVRARDAAGNRSGWSGTVSGTTQAGGGGGGGGGGGSMAAAPYLYEGWGDPPAPGTGHTSFEKADKSSRFTDAQLAPFNGTTAGRLPRDCRTAVSTWPTDCLHDRAVPSGSAQQLVQVVRTGLQVTGARQHVQVLGVAQQAGTGEE